MPGFVKRRDIQPYKAEITKLHRMLHSSEPMGTAAAAMDAHMLDADPHTQYLTASEGNASYAMAGHTHPGLAPPGGSTGQVLKKTTNADYNYGWAADSTGGGGYTLVATLASDAGTGANVTPVSLTGLVFNYEANSKYRIWFMGRVAPAAATTGCGFQFDLSSAVTAIDLQFFHQLAITGTLSGGHSIADDVSVGVSSGLPGTSTYPVTGFGLLVTGANTGTAQLRFRSETTAIITAKAGLTLVVEKVA